MAARRARACRRGTTKAFAERLFARELDGHPMLVNRSLWRAFPTIRNDRWHHGRVVLVGDAAHTAHFSIGSGTKLAMEDAIALSGALQTRRDVPTALAAYEAERRPQVEAIQRAAQTSLEWFEQAERYHGRLEPVQMAFSLLTRSLRVTHDNLRARDPKLVATVDGWFAARVAASSGPGAPAPRLVPPSACATWCSTTVSCLADVPVLGRTASERWTWSTWEAAQWAAPGSSSPR